MQQGFESSQFSYIGFIQNKHNIYNTQILGVTDESSKKTISQNLFNDSQNEDIRNLQYFLSEISDIVSEEFYDSMKRYLDEKWKLEILQFCMVIFFQLVIVSLFWSRFYDILKQQVQQIKSMLNIIPVNII